MKTISERACPFVTAGNKLARESARLVDAAIVAWAASCEMTPEQWLRYWRPVLRQEIGVDMSLRMIVEAKAIESFESHVRSRYQPEPEPEVE